MSTESYFIIKLASRTNSVTTKIFETDLKVAIRIAENSWKKFGGLTYHSHTFVEIKKPNQEVEREMELA